MSVETHIYDQRFFANSLELEGPSARAVAAILIKHFKPDSIIDIGCGNGIYLREFEKNNIAILGYDGAPAAIAYSLVGDKVKLHDLCEPLKVDQIFDLCLCFEVAEHLSEKYANTLVETLVKLSNTIIFTAATPGQGPRSIGHINEQPHEYWVEKFSHKNFVLQTELTEAIRKEMVAQDVVWWIAQNLMVYKKQK